MLFLIIPFHSRDRYESFVPSPASLGLRFAKSEKSGTEVQISTFDSEVQ